MDFSDQQSEVGEGYPLETVASFSCNEGYNLSGPDDVTCELPGEWNRDQDPQCNLGK